MKIGAHVSTSGGLLNAFSNAIRIGAQCFQIFTSSPRMWKVSPVDLKIAILFKQALKDNDMEPSFAHIKYLVNLASPDEDIAQKSITTVIDELRVCSQLGLKGAMFHIGAPKDTDPRQGIRKVVNAAKKVLSETPDDTLLILENSASSKKLGSTMEEIAEIMHKINNQRVAVCLDTAHALAAGYDLRTVEQVDSFVTIIEKTVGLSSVVVLHVNDSKAALNTGRDLHENIGKGELGIQSFSHLLNHPKLSDKPFILEVPGYDNQGPDKQNIDVLKQLIK